MNFRSLSLPAADAEVVQRALRAVVRVVWTAVRVPLVAVLVILEPVVRVLLAGLALLLVLTALFLEAVSQHSIPFWGMLSLAVGCVAVLALYHALLRLLSA